MSVRTKGTATLAAVGLVVAGFMYFTDDAWDARDVARPQDQSEKMVELVWTTRIDRVSAVTWTIGNDGAHETTEEITWSKKTVGHVGENVSLFIHTTKYGYGTCSIIVNDKQRTKVSGRLWDCAVMYTIHSFD